MGDDTVSGDPAPPDAPRTAFRVRVPATSANLGPGYDSAGLALGIYDEVTGRRTPGGLAVSVRGVGAGTLPNDGSHLVVRAAVAAFAAMGEPLPGLDLRCDNAIPHGSGQGSSAAAIVAGVLLARALTPDGARRLDDAAVLDLAARLEGHPDNVAPALLGGFTIAWGRDPARAVRLAPHPGLRAIVFTADRACDTRTARAVLPAVVPHADAAANAARSALLVHAVTADPGLLLPATEDRLHQPYRRSVMPETAALLDRLRSAGIAAVLSGAGPSVLALGCDLPEPESLGGSGFRASEVPIAMHGAAVDPAG